VVEVWYSRDVSLSDINRNCVVVSKGFFLSSHNDVIPMRESAFYVFWFYIMRSRYQKWVLSQKAKLSSRRIELRSMQPQCIILTTVRTRPIVRCSSKYINTSYLIFYQKPQTQQKSKCNARMMKNMLMHFIFVCDSYISCHSKQRLQS
jgi:hypothetical protein